MRACDLRGTHRTKHFRGHRLAIVGELNAFGLKPYLNTLGFECALDRRANFRILLEQKPRVFLYHRDIAAKSSIHLREFKANVTSADDHQMRRQLLEFEKRCACQERDTVNAGKGGN